MKVFEYVRFPPRYYPYARTHGWPRRTFLSGFAGMNSMGGMGGMGGGMPRGGPSRPPMFDEDDDMDGSSFASFGGMPGGMPRTRPSRSNTGAGRPSTPSTPSEITRPLKVSLEDLYTGSTKHLKVGRKLADGWTEEKVLEVAIQPGWKAGTKVRFPRAGNETSSGEAQDLVFVVEEKPHARFGREGNDLVAKERIGLVEALTNEGGKRQVTLPDGKKVQVNVPAGVVNPGQETKVKGEGFQFRKPTPGRGDLVVKWEVVFPDRLSASQKEGVKKVLG
ncbi:hypothetical protein OF83DRAFT_1095370 [Amylostereum chailletii]|nr:hypothetical protein OF83DRAFT_1095370 [Amylostereum chailletii]